jgi:hypothetical protein
MTQRDVALYLADLHAAHGECRHKLELVVDLVAGDRGPPTRPPR